jgi:UDP-3-O-[3-hydroxymyristoyl] glucosamine N-acyltransferase
VPKNSQELTRSLDRARGALAKARRTDGALEARKTAPGPAATSLGALAVALTALAFATGQHWLLYVAVAAAAAGGLIFVGRQVRGPLGGSAGHAQVGMGATVAADAVLEPGARVEMGASVGAGAVVRSDAVVRMGANVGARAVIERGALVSWGASVFAEAPATAGELPRSDRARTRD